MIKAVFFDVDGTLLSHNTYQIPDSAKRALVKLRDSGIIVALATGRSMPELRALPDVLEQVYDGFITMNGQLCLDKTGNVISASPITGRSKEELIAEFKKKEIPIILVKKEELFINFLNDRVKVVMDEIHTPIPEIKDYQGEEIYMGAAFVDKTGEAPLADKLKECDFARWHPGAVNVLGKGGSKKKGIQKFIEIYGLARDEIMAVGDGDNDLEMIEYAGIGVVMGNGTELAKKAADYITTDIDDSGIKNALEHFALI